MSQEQPSILDEGLVRRMRLGDACSAYAAFVIGTAIVLGIALSIVAWVFDWSLGLGACVAVGGSMIIIPMGWSAIAIVWKYRLGENYSAKLRKGDFRFAGIMVPLFVLVAYILGEYLVHLPEGHLFAEAFVVPPVITGLTTFFALQDRVRKPQLPEGEQEK